MRYLLILFSCFTFSQQGRLYTLAFYNVENLFDAIDDPKTFDDDYTPEGRNKWTSQLVDQKVRLISNILFSIGNEETKRPPFLIGLVEVENKKVVEKIASSEKLKAYNYGIAHFESPDFRGIDTALLYRKTLFRPTHQKAYALELVDHKTGAKRTTRDILVVSGYLNQHHITVLINHWPSRRGGKMRSAPQRFKAAQLHRRITDSVARKHPQSKIISMGDYNDDPKDKSIQWIMKKKEEKILHNPMLALAKKGIGSLAYNDRWHLFDQMLFSLNWYGDPSLFLLKTAVYSPAKLRTLRGRYQGYPFRTQTKGNTLEGYSDHFPVYTILGERKD